MAARLSIIVPTHDGDGLDTLFASLEGQLRDGDEVLIVGDTCDDEFTHIRFLVESSGFRFLSHNSGHHCWGHCQVNAGMQAATGDYLVFIDDDDCFPPQALEAIRRAAAEQVSPRPLMFRFWSERHGVYLPPRHEVRESAIGGHCMVTPNVPGKLGMWTCRYAGDFDWIVSTLEHYPDGPVWYDDVIACA